MDKLKGYSVQFSGLAIGTHELEYLIDDAFFEAFPYSEIHHGRFEANVLLDKKERMMMLQIRIQGEAEVTCDRCGDCFMLPLEVNEPFCIKFGAEHQDEGDDVIVLAENEHSFQLAELFYEFIHLALPAKLIHLDDAEGNTGCNQEAMEMLKHLSTPQQEDPRWEALKNLKNNE